MIQKYMNISTLNISRLGGGPLRAHEHGWFKFDDVASLLQAHPQDVVIIDLPPAEASLAMRELRHTPNYAHRLIYLAGQSDAYGEALSDGREPENLQDIQREAQSWRTRRAQLGPSDTDWSLTSSLMAWLWLRTGRELLPVRDATRQEIYVYPMIEALRQNLEGSASWTLQLAAHQGWIQSGELVDRIRQCTHCSSGHLNYVDVCPECDSLSIERQHALHCFVCGHVGPQENFTKDRGLLCPNCLSRLRHIGSDYDRPMENFGCRSCQAFFVDANVEARCLDCGQSCEPADLKVREIFHYSLTEAGRLRCRQGMLDRSVDIDSHFQLSGMLPQSAFTSLLDWTLDIVRRYKRSTVSLVGIRLGNFQETLDSLGESKGYALLDAVVKRLVEIIRDTDRCMRSSEDAIWILLPETDVKGAKRVVERLAVLMEEFQRAQVEVDIKITSFTAPEDAREGESAELLLQRLLGQLYA